MGLKATAAFLAACLLLSYPRLGQAASSVEQLASYDWSATMVPNLAANPPPERVVAAFFASEAFLRSTAQSGKFCSFRFADLRHSRNLSLVIQGDNSGRMFCGEIYVVDKTPMGLLVYGGGVARGYRQLDAFIKDLNGDGNLELVLPAELTWYVGAAHCQATWPVVYAWTGTDYTNVSDRFPDFYRHEVDSLNRQIARIAARESSGAPRLIGEPAYYRECLEAEAGKIQRVLGNSEAGLDRAITWSRSGDPEQRIFAVQILMDIGTPEALKYLGPLSRDPDRMVSEPAKTFLANPHTPIAERMRGVGPAKFQQYQPIPIISSKQKAPQ